MLLRSDDFSDGAPLPAELAFAVPHATAHLALSDNRNPHLAWDDVPADTLSFVLVCHDPDVPSSGEDVNQEGREVPSALPRVDFVHWALLDIPAQVRAIETGSHSDGVVPRGKPGPEAPGGLRHATNDYTGWFAADPAMAGSYYGYDGPCPPWNDSLIHHYVFTLYALAVPSLPVVEEPGTTLDGAAVRAALSAAPVLATAALTGTYTLNPRLRR
ncbi:hypothetical protein SAMN06264364_10881 [Quadrisphaera granulorum]|uniref:PBP family phospholipid-binding protein n=1 Tax=Quadrisphaera granulorum TaxID=317664 RepID=A0A316ABE5_9ACTN|nr:YbhB/YbcL family Raf kinase inhibitor-like protein [Quadrisphaera granulorum]PWJ54174.1 hypothetical protein BXY45_10881 [Quadrisphaera granulorum]SZE96313.1 hypothetical protein SAMN06264364_10881 [Quadrisphaera granulorum]